MNEPHFPKAKADPFGIGPTLQEHLDQTAIIPPRTLVFGPGGSIGIPLAEQPGVIGKDTNPKDAIATNKVPLDLVPPITTVYASLGHLEGALKYGKWNWRHSGVKASVYIGALKRHIAAYESGENISENGVPHLANALACIGILLDANLCGKLTDDRAPRSVQLVELMKAMEEDVAKLREKFKDCKPKHYSIADSPKEI